MIYQCTTVQAYRDECRRPSLWNSIRIVSQLLFQLERAYHKGACFGNFAGRWFRLVARNFAHGKCRGEKRRVWCSLIIVFWASQTSYARRFSRWQSCFHYSLMNWGPRSEETVTSMFKWGLKSRESEVHPPSTYLKTNLPMWLLRASIGIQSR